LTRYEKDAAAYWARAFVPAIRAAVEADDDALTDAMMARIKHPHWVPERPGEKLPHMWKIVCYWVRRLETSPFVVDLEVPHCFRCGIIPNFINGTLAYQWGATGGMLEKGHLVNRARDGLDTVQNLVPLCRFCNVHMPIFGVEHGTDAVAWVAAGGGPGRVAARMWERDGVEIRPDLWQAPQQITKRRNRARGELSGQTSLF
jgi:hypothetical protein